MGKEPTIGQGGPPATDWQHLDPHRYYPLPPLSDANYELEGPCVKISGWLITCWVRNYEAPLLFQGGVAEGRGGLARAKP